MNANGRRGGKATGSTLSAEERAFLDFVAKLAVEQALRETNGADSLATCSPEQASEKSKDDGNA